MTYGELTALHPAFNPSQSAPGYILALVAGALSVVDDHGNRRPTVAEAVPSVENGLWRVFPDGHMETAFRIRPGAQWHDGAPVTSHDLLFTTRVEQDKSMPEFRSAAYDAVDSVEAVDPQQVVIRWKQPYIWADRMFGGGGGNTLPAHLLEDAFVNGKDSFRDLPYWTDPAQYAGFGPFKVKDWTRGSGMLLGANDQYVLGRPHIDQIEIKFIYDDQTFVANILANNVDISLGTTLAIEQAVDLRNRWGDGRLILDDSNWIALYPQFLNPNPAVVADVRFRRALIMAIDRQAMADTIQGGLEPVADSWVSPHDLEYADTISAAVKYEYDPRKGGQMIQDIGYTRGADGGILDSKGERLSLEVRTIANPAIHTRSFFPVVDYWQQLGVAIDPVVIPAQRITDLEYRTQQPTFELIRYGNGAESVNRLRSTQTPLPENNYKGNNRSRWMDPATDALVDRYYSTTPWPERTQVMRDVVHLVSDQLIVMGLFYDARAYFVSNRMQSVFGGTMTWNAHEWDV